MHSVILISFSIVLAVLAHSTLMYFYADDEVNIPLWRLFFPAPSRGKIVSILCAVLSGFFLYGAIILLDNPMNWRWQAWRNLVVMGGVPLALYATYLIRRVKRDPLGNLIFVPSHATSAEWKAPILISAVVSLVSMVV